MESSSISTKGILSLLVLLAIGLLSLAIVYLRLPTSSIFIDGNKLEASKYAVALFDKSGSLIFSLSPQNDFFYDGNARFHIEDSLSRSTDGGVLRQLYGSLEGIIFNRNILNWNTLGSNSRGRSTEDYRFNYSSNNLEVTRTIALGSEANDIGQVLTICSGCLVVDNKDRAYFNGDFVNQDNVNLASRLKFAPLIVGENQAFPSDISKIFIFDRFGNLKLEIPLSNEEVFLQDRWHLLEIKAPVDRAKNATVKENIYIHF